jgi:hypothetical protein
LISTLFIVHSVGLKGHQYNEYRMNYLELDRKLSQILNTDGEIPDSASTYPYTLTTNFNAYEVNI